MGQKILSIGVWVIIICINMLTFTLESVDNIPDPDMLWHARYEPISDGVIIALPCDIIIYNGSDNSVAPFILLKLSMSMGNILQVCHVNY